jgi:transcriptional regulator with XRE-family HTH domain
MTPLRVAREMAGLDIERAARACGVSTVYLAAMERKGASALTWPRAQRLARAYDVPVNHLIGGAFGTQGRKRITRLGSRPSRQSTVEDR